DLRTKAQPLPRGYASGRPGPGRLQTTGRLRPRCRASGEGVSTTVLVRPDDRFPAGALEVAVLHRQGAAAHPDEVAIERVGIGQGATGDGRFGRVAVRYDRATVYGGVVGEGTFADGQRAVLVGDGTAVPRTPGVCAVARQGAVGD